jgi:hypothetical protein
MLCAICTGVAIGRDFTSRLACAREQLHILMLADGSEVKPVQPGTTDKS